MSAPNALSRERKVPLEVRVRSVTAVLTQHPEWLGWTGLLVALLVLLSSLGTASDFALVKWISSDTLYPVNVFVDVFRDHYPISGWRFSIAPCWFPDLAATGVFWALTRNPILATLLAGFIQIPVIVICLRLIARTIGIRKLFLQDTLLLACGAGVALYVAARPDIGYPYFFKFFLPQTHVGSMLLVLAGWSMALQMIREARQAERARLWFVIAYAVLCGLAGMSNVLFFPHMLVPLAAALALSLFFGLMTVRQCWVPVVVGWVAAAIGAVLNRVLFTTSDVGLESSINFESAMTALDVFARGFVSRLLMGDGLHICAVLWAGISIGYLAWFLRNLVMSGISRAADSQLITAVFFAMSLVSSVASVGAIVVGGSNGLVQLKDYVWSMHYLHQVFLLPVFGLVACAAWVFNRVLTHKAAAILAWTVAGLTVVATATRLIAVQSPPTPIYAYRPPVVRFVDSIAREKHLHYGYAGYWQARVITLLSRTGLRAYAVDGRMNPYLWVSNLDWYTQSLEDRTKVPRISFVVLGDPLTRDIVASAFGEPVWDVKAQGTRILVYKESDDVNAYMKAGQLNAPLSSFSEDIQSPIKMLDLRSAEKTLVPITLRNTGTALWSTTGQYPVTISYKWFDHGKMLPIEGERTRLPGRLKPGDSVNVKVNVVAPGTTGDLVLKLSLVQEGVAWFMTAGAAPLELPVTVH